MKRIISLSIAILSILFVRAQNCPGIIVESPAELTAGDTLVFIVGTKGVEVHPTYNWTVSAGTIMSGQGTAKIMVNTEGLDGMFVTATVELGGLAPKCISTSSSSTEIIAGAQLIVSGTFTKGQELKNAVQKFIAATNFKDSDTEGTGFIYLYKGATTTESALKIFKDAIIGAFGFNKILPSRYQIVNGGSKKLGFYEMYLLLPGGKEPKPSK